MRAAVLIAFRDLTSRLRDRSALIVGFVAPVALALIISFAIGGGSDAFHAEVGVVDLDGGDIAAVFTGDVLGSEDVQNVFTVRVLATREEAVAAVEARELSAAFVIHDGLDRITVLRSPTARVAGEIATSIAQSFAAQVTGVSQAIGVSAMVTMFGPDAFDATGFRSTGFEGVAFDPGDLDAIDFGALAEAVTDAPMPVELVDASTGPSELSSASYFGPGMAMLFVFFLLSAAPRSLLREAETGTLARLRAAPIAIASIIAGKALAVSLLGLTSMCVVWLVTTLVFGASWGNPLAVLALLVAFVLAALGISTVVSVYAKTESQADGFVTVVTFVMALQGFMTLTADGGGLGTILGPVAAVLAFAAVAFAAAVPGLRKWTAA